MKTVVTMYWKIFAALLVIFVSGSGFGYFTAQNSPRVQPLETEETSAWPEFTLSKLREALNLSDEQVAMISPHVEAVGEKVTQERDRAMLQISLQVLEMHDSLDGYLHEAQKQKLEKSRKSMKLHIERKFSSLMDNHAP
jgi:C4-dicarboxylate-specific signal transduction histidine kinase